MIRFARIEIGTGGLVRCAKCSRESAREPFPAARVAESLAGAAAGWTHGPGPNAILTGFEPFAHPELPRVVADARAAGFTRICLRTDAGALSLGGNAQGVIGAGVTQLEVMVVGGTDATHDALAGRPGFFAAAAAGARAFSAAGAASGDEVRVGVRARLCRHNISEAPAMAAWAAAVGADTLCLEAADLTLASREIALVTAALDTATVNGVAAWVEAPATDAIAPLYLVPAYVVEEVGL